MKVINKEKFDCIKMKEQLQAYVYAETKNMTKAELLHYFNDCKGKKPSKVYQQGNS